MGRNSRIPPTMIWMPVNSGSSVESRREHTGAAAVPEGPSFPVRIIPEDSEYPLDGFPKAEGGLNRIPKGAVAVAAAVPTASGQRQARRDPHPQAMRRKTRDTSVLAKTQFAKEAFPRPPPRNPVPESRPRRRPRLSGPRNPNLLAIAIAFVEELERAHQVFQFRDHLRMCDWIKHDSSAHDVFYDFLGSDVVKKRFYLADDDDIFTALEFYILDLRAQQAGQVREKMYNGFVFPNPMYYLIFRAREEGYVLRKNLMAELDNLRKFAPMFYRDCLVWRKQPVGSVEARTVTVSNFSPEYSWKYIREFFSCCGPVEKVEMQSTSEGPSAQVTFKDVTGVKHALIYSGIQVSCLSRGKEEDDDGYFVPLSVERKWDEAARNAETVGIGELEDDISNKHAQALNKYSELRTYYSEFQAKKGVRACKTEAVWGDCQWMGLEAVANGGFTLGGLRLS